MSKREIILQTALKLFVEKGFHGASTANIAKVANVATGTLFHHFPTKNELIHILFVEVRNKLSDQLQNQIAEGTLRSKLYQMWCRYLDWSQNNPDDFAFFLLFSSSPYLQEIKKENPNSHLGFLKELFVYGQQQEILKDTDVDLLLDMGWGIVRSTAIHFLENPDKYKDSHCRQQAFQIMWDAIKS